MYYVCMYIVRGTYVYDVKPNVMKETSLICPIFSLLLQGLLPVTHKHILLTPPPPPRQRGLSDNFCRSSESLKPRKLSMTGAFLRILFPGSNNVSNN